LKRGSLAETDGSPPPRRCRCASATLAQVLDPGQAPPESGTKNRAWARLARRRPRVSSLSRAPPPNHGGSGPESSIRLRQLALPREVLLADEFLNRAVQHALGQWGLEIDRRPGSSSSGSPKRSLVSCPGHRDGFLEPSVRFFRPSANATGHDSCQYNPRFSRGRTPLPCPARSSRILLSHDAGCGMIAVRPWADFAGISIRWLSQGFAHRSVHQG